MTEAHTHQTYRNPSLATDIVTYCYATDDELRDSGQDFIPSNDGGRWEFLMLISRKNPPFQTTSDTGPYCLPGGFVDYGESPVSAARRELQEETSVASNRPLSLVGVYGEPDRDPRQHVVSIAYSLQVSVQEIAAARAADDAIRLLWVPRNRIQEMSLGFDHHQILSDFFGDTV